MTAIDLHIRRHTATLTVNRPAVRNALTVDAMSQFAAAIEQIRQTATVRTLIITGAGKAFISGGDIADLHRQEDEALAARMTALMGDALDSLAQLPCITIAAIEGPARGGGCEVALACDWRVAAEDADMGFVHIRLGLTTGWGGSARLQKLVGYARALDLLTLGRVISASEAYHIGLVTLLAAPDEALQSAQHIADSLALYDADALRAYKRILQAPSAAQANAIERAEFEALWSGETHRRAVQEFLAKSTALKP